MWGRKRLERQNQENRRPEEAWRRKCLERRNQENRRPERVWGRKCLERHDPRDQEHADRSSDQHNGRVDDGRDVDHVHPFASSFSGCVGVDRKSVV